MSTLVKADNRTWVQKLLASVVKKSPLSLPAHVGFILDGNRRYAKGKNMKSIEGHNHGFQKLANANRWCLDLGIQEITIYVFSIENFKRSKEEVDGIMKLVKKVFEKLLEEIDKMNRDGVCVEIVGDWSLFPADIKPLMAKAMTMTKNNTKIKINIAFAYTARNEMTRGLKCLVAGAMGGDIEIEDFSEKLLEDTFRIHTTRPLDLLIRTSGESRLSDFLLWQSSETVLCFIDVMWPDISYWQFLSVLLQYQLHHLLISKIVVPKKGISPSKAETRKAQFVDKLRVKQWNNLAVESNSKELL